jgi:hypothetical protein
MASQPIYQFYAELDDYTPKVWRRFQVQGNVTIARLAYILMTLFEMQASHIYTMEVRSEDIYARHAESSLIREKPFTLRYDPPGFGLPADDENEVFDATKFKLMHVVRSPGSRLYLSYDFGDGWGVTLTLEEVFKDRSLPGRELPRVLDGRGYGIIENCGGPGGLDQLRKAFTRKRGKDYKRYREWLGVDELDLDSFDVDDMNFRLKKVPRIYSDIYELELPPTAYSMSILNRDYQKD